MLAEFLQVSGFAFWIIVAGIIVLDTILLATDGENEGWAVFFTVAALVGAVLFTDAFKGVRVSYLLAGLLAYIVIGVIWSFKKWYSYVVQQLRDLREVFDRNKPRDRTFEDYAKDKRPTAANNKQRIIGWMALWPWSLTWWVLTWPRHAFVWMYDRLSTVFDRISAKIWASAAGHQ